MAVNRVARQTRNIPTSEYTYCCVMIPPVAGQWTIAEPHFERQMVREQCDDRKNLPIARDPMPTLAFTPAIAFELSGPLNRRDRVCSTVPRYCWRGVNFRSVLRSWPRPSWRSVSAGERPCVLPRDPCRHLRHRRRIRSLLAAPKTPTGLTNPPARSTHTPC